MAYTMSNISRTGNTGIYYYTVTTFMTLSVTGTVDDTYILTSRDHLTNVSH